MTWSELLVQAVIRVAKLHSERAELQVAEIRGKQDQWERSSATSVSAMEMEAKLATSELRAEITKLSAEIAGLEQTISALHLFIQTSTPYDTGLESIVNGY